jgi:hypothetical protein
MAHLGRIGQGLALALEVASGAIASERLERIQRIALVGQVAERAMIEIGEPLDRLFGAVGRIRGRPEGPPWLLEELLGLGTDLARTKGFRDSVLDFTANRVPAPRLVSVDELLEESTPQLEASLRPSGITLAVDHGAGAAMVRAEPFLLRCAIASAVEHLLGSNPSREGLHLETRLVEGGVAFSVTARPSSPDPERPSPAVPDFLAWSLDRRVSAFGLALLKTVVEHFKGRWEIRGDERRIVLTLPTSAD